MIALYINGSHPKSRVSVIGILTWYRMDVSAIECQQEKGFFLLSETSRPALGCTQPSLQEMLILLTGLIRPEHEVDHSPPSSAKVKNEWS